MAPGCLPDMSAHPQPKTTGCFTYTNTEVITVAKISVDYGYNMNQDVWGSSNASPPWSTPFTPLSSNDYPTTFHLYPHDVAYGATCHYHLNYTRDTGNESWKWVEEGQEIQPVETRFRYWEYSPAVVHTHG